MPTCGSNRSVLSPDDLILSSPMLSLRSRLLLTGPGPAGLGGAPECIYMLALNRSDSPLGVSGNEINVTKSKSYRGAERWTCLSRSLVDALL